MSTEVFKARVLPPDQSLGVLMGQLRLDHFCNVETNGLGWVGPVAEIKLDQLDELVKTYGSFSPEGDELWRETKKTRSGGIVEHPSVRAKGGEVFTFNSARFQDDSFVVITTRQLGKAKPTTHEYTISELRTELSSLLTPRPLLRKVGQFLSSFVPGR